MTDRLMLKPAEAADAIGVSRSKVYELLAQGKLPKVMVGGSVRIPVKQLQAWIDEHVADVARSA